MITYRPEGQSQLSIISFAALRVFTAWSYYILKILKTQLKNAVILTFFVIRPAFGLAFQKFRLRSGNTYFFARSTITFSATDLGTSA